MAGRDCGPFFLVACSDTRWHGLRNPSHLSVYVPLWILSSRMASWSQTNRTLGGSKVISVLFLPLEVYWNQANVLPGAFVRSLEDATKTIRTSFLRQVRAIPVRIVTISRAVVVD